MRGLEGVGLMKFSEVLQPDCVRVPLVSRERNAVIAELVDLLHASGRITDREAVLEAILNREATRSTGIGQGLAVPHGKSWGCDRLVMALGKAATPIDFQSVDGRPCYFVVLLASPVDETGPHIQALAKVSRMWLDEQVRAAIQGAETAEEVYALLKGRES